MAQLIINVRDLVDATQLKKDLAFTTNDLSSAMMTQSALFSHYGVLAADASRQVDILKLALENKEAAIYKIERDSAAASGEKVTETMLEKQIALNPEVINFKKALNKARRIESVCKTAVESFRHRRDMLIQLGLLEREEMKGELRIMGQRANQEVIENSKERELERMRRRNQE